MFWLESCLLCISRGGGFVRHWFLCFKWQLYALLCKYATGFYLIRLWVWSYYLINL